MAPDFITVVSGLPRSGTSLMMQMLHAGGLPALTDGLRTADENNLRGYLEFEPVKRLRSDRSWLPQARGKVVKIIHLLLRDLLLDGVGVPEIATKLEGRHALIVVRGYDYREDLKMLRPYVREYRPILIGVDGGADALVEAGYTPDLIVGDMDSVTDEVLRCGAEVVVHAYADGRAPGLERVQDLGVRAIVFPAAGTSEDVAMLLADDKGAELIVAVGTHATLVEFLDKGRSGMASTFLTRLRVGSKLVDAKGVSLLYRARISNVQLGLLVVAGLFALGVALASTASGQTLFGLFGARFDDLFSWVGSLFGGA